MSLNGERDVGPSMTGPQSTHQGPQNSQNGLDNFPAVLVQANSAMPETSHSQSHALTSLDSFKNEDPSANPSSQYYDWASQFFVDGSQDILENFDFSAAPSQNNHIMQKIQYQNNVHDQPDKQGPQTQSSHQQQPDAQHQPPPAQHRTPAQDSADAENPATKNTKPKTKRPCDNCRRRKMKCVVIPGTNNCAQCESRSLTCTFTTQAQGYVDGNGAKRLKAGLGASTDHMDPTSSSIDANAYDVAPPNVPIRTVAPVHDYSVMNNSLLKKTLSLQYPRSSLYVGPTSYLFDTNLLEVIIASQNKMRPGNGQGSGRPGTLNKIEQVNLSDSISLRKVDNKTQFILKDDQSKSSFQTMSNDVDAIEKFIAPHGQILIDLYFRIIHPSYPILHKKVFLEKYSRTHREFSAPLLGAVYVLAIQWWDYDPQLNRFAKPNVEMILKIAFRNYILEILKRPKLSAVQAGLLLLQCKHIFRDAGASSTYTGPHDSASASLSSSFSDSDYNDWVLCSQVVAVAEELGLGLDCDTWKLPKWERGLRKRLAWAVFLEDKWLSLKNSRPSHINDLNWVVSDLAEEDFPEKHGDGDLKEGSSDINNGKNNFINLINLSRIVGEILNTLFSMRAMKDITDINEVLRIAKPIQLKLRTWYHSLPVELQMNSVQPRKLCSNGYLQLAYFAAELTLHRKIITTLYQQSTRVPDELLNVCRSAAKTRLQASIGFVRDLKPEHIHSFWHSSSASNFTLIGTFAALLFISATSKEEADSLKEQIFNYRWILKISSKGFVQVGDALNKLDLVLSHIPGLLNDSAEQPMMVPNVPTVDYSKIYPQSQMPRSQQVSRQSPLSYQSPQMGPQRPFSGEGYRSSSYQQNNSQQDGQGRNLVQQPRESLEAMPSPVQRSHSAASSAMQGHDSPHTTNSHSPQENMRQSKSNVVNNAQSRYGSSASTPQQMGEGHGRTNSASVKGSPVLIKSPLGQPHNQRTEENTAQ